MSDTIAVVIVDDHELIRDAMTHLVGSLPQIRVVGAASSVHTAGPVLEETAPDLVLADLSLGDGSGVELVRLIRQSRLKTRVLIFTGSCDGFAASEALKAGVSGYLLKTESTHELTRAITTVVRGAIYVSPAVADRLPQPASATGAPSGLTALSRRESEIFRLVVTGMSSLDIARRLFISIKTVETHRSNINRKLSVRSASDLIRLAVSHGLSVGPGSFAHHV